MNSIPVVSPVAQWTSSRVSLEKVTLDAASASPRGPKAAREFEACLIASLLESLERSFVGFPGEQNRPGTEDYSQMATEALSRTMADAGGFGIASMIRKHLPSER
jgi:Rod binding domain-containing protein